MADVGDSHISCLEGFQAKPPEKLRPKILIFLSRSELKLWVLSSMNIRIS